MGSLLILSRLLLLILVSKKIYKTHITKWGIEKRLKEIDARTIICHYHDRMELGKSSALQVRGRDRDYFSAIRHLERKHVPIADVLAQRGTFKKSDAVRCFTPLPSPINIPEMLATQERVIFMLRDYHNSSFESGLWSQDPRQEFFETTKVRFDPLVRWGTFRDHCAWACCLFEVNCFQTAGQELDAAFAEIKDIIWAEHPTTFTRLLELIVHFRRMGKAQIASITLRYFSSMGRELLGNSHPLSFACGLLVSLIESSQVPYEDLISRSLTIIADAFEDRLGPLHMQTIQVRMLSVFASSRAYTSTKGKDLPELYYHFKFPREISDLQIQKIMLYFPLRTFGTNHDNLARAPVFAKD